MKNSRKQLKVEGAAELPHVIHYLQQLVAALEAGAVEVRQGDAVVHLGPRGVVGFALKAGEQGKRQHLSLELSWRKLKVPETALDLQIGTPGTDDADDADDGDRETAIAGGDDANPEAAANIEVPVAANAVDE